MTVLSGRSVEVEALAARASTSAVFSLPRGVGVHVRLRSLDRSSLDDVRPECVRVDNRGEVWQTRLGDSPGRGQDQNGYATLDAAAGDGPRWEPGTTVQVTAWLRLSAKLTAIEFAQVTIQRAE